MSSIGVEEERQNTRLSHLEHFLDIKKEPENEQNLIFHSRPEVRHFHRSLQMDERINRTLYR